MEQYRQGDVFIRRVRSLPKERRELPRENGRVVLAHGEATGHAHAISAPNVSLFDAGGRTFLSIGVDTVALEHEEHSTIDLPAGDYEVVRQVEYTPEAIRRVAD